MWKTIFPRSNFQNVSHETLHQNRITASNKPQANKKFFGAAVFQKCCRGVGEQPTFAKQIQFCSLFFLLQLHFLKLANSQFDCLCETSCKFRQGNGAIAARWQAKAGVEPPFAGCGRPFSLKADFFCKAFPLQLFPRNSCKILVSCSVFTRRSGLVRPASKSSRFSHHPLRVPKAWHGDFAACGQRSGLLALNLASIFEKLLDQKTFRFCAPHR